MPIVGQFGSLAGLGSLILPGGAMESIATVTVGSGGASSITFSDIPGGYQHLQLRWIARGSRSANTDSFRLQFNSDTSASNYVRYHLLYGDGSSALADNTLTGVNATVIVGNGTAASASASIFGVGITDILDYTSTSKNKVIRSFNGNDRNGAGGVNLWSSMWMNTSAITSIVVSMENGNFVQYTTASLYGVRA